jgi:hypothetical protein
MSTGGARRPSREEESVGEASAARGVRHFLVYRGRQLVLEIEDRPGTLHSRAAPGASGPPHHPFIHATAYDALSEDELGGLLRESRDFDDYLARLVAAGYDLMSATGGWEMRIEPGFRLVDSEGAAGVAWPFPGQAACAWWQPPPGEYQFEHATVTVYRREAADRVLAQLAATDSFPAFREALEREGLRFEPVTEPG